MISLSFIFLHIFKSHYLYFTQQTVSCGISPKIIRRRKHGRQQIRASQFPYQKEEKNMLEFFSTIRSKAYILDSSSLGKTLQKLLGCQAAKRGGWLPVSSHPPKWSKLTFECFGGYLWPFCSRIEGPLKFFSILPPTWVRLD